MSKCPLLSHQPHLLQIHLPSGSPTSKNTCSRQLSDLNNAKVYSMQQKVKTGIKLLVRLNLMHFMSYTHQLSYIQWFDYQTFEYEPA